MQLKRIMGMEISNIKMNWGSFPSSPYQESEPGAECFIGGKLSFYALVESELPADAKVSQSY